MQVARSLLEALLRQTTTLNSTSSYGNYWHSPKCIFGGAFHSAFAQSQIEFRSRRSISNVVVGIRKLAVGGGGIVVEQNSVGQRGKPLYAVPGRFGSTSNVGQESKKWRVSALFLFLPCVATFGLGTWQLYRRQWKIEVLDYRRKRLEEEPIPLVNAIAGAFQVSDTAGLKDVLDKTSGDELEFRKVICEGVYDDSNSLYVGPRARSAFGVTQKGYFLISPLSIQDGKKSVQVPVLVNRGWVPSTWIHQPAPAKPSLPPGAPLNEVKAGRIPWWKFWIRQKKSFDNEVTFPKMRVSVKVHGVIRGSEQPNMFVPSNVPNDAQWFYIDVPAMARTLGLPENTILIEALQESTSSEAKMKEKFPIAKDPEALLHTSVMPQDHINYALTWYSLSAATTFMAVKRVWGSGRV